MPARLPLRRLDRLVIVLAALAGALLSLLLGNWYFNRDDRWTRIVSPQDEKPVEILAVDRGLNLYVRTQEGNVYLCGGNSWRDVCHKAAAADVPVVSTPAQWRTCSGPFPTVPAAPGAIVDSIEVGRCLEATTYSKLVVLDDGTLWQWQRTFSWVNAFARTILVVLGLGIGFAVGGFVVKLWRALR